MRGNRQGADDKNEQWAVLFPPSLPPSFISLFCLLSFPLPPFTPFPTSSLLPFPFSSPGGLPPSLWRKLSGWWRKQTGQAQRAGPSEARLDQGPNVGRLIKTWAPALGTALLSLLRQHQRQPWWSCVGQRNCGDCCWRFSSSNR